MWFEILKYLNLSVGSFNILSEGGKEMMCQLPHTLIASVVEGEKPKMLLLRTFNPWELRYLARWVQIIYTWTVSKIVWVSQCVVRHASWCSSCWESLRQPAVLSWKSAMTCFHCRSHNLFCVYTYTSCSIHDIEPILGIAKLMKSL